MVVSVLYLDNVFRVIREDFETKKWWMEMVICVFALLSPENWDPQLGLGNDSYLCFFFQETHEIVAIKKFKDSEGMCAILLL